MADKPKREPLKCPVSQEHKEIVKEVADTVKIHINVVKKVIE